MIDLEKATELRERLSKLEDQLNERISAAEQRINGFGFGVRCFINLDDKNFEFGYSKEADGWGLYVHRKVPRLEWKLSRAPRSFRITCLERIGELEEHLFKAAAKHAERLEKFLSEDSPLSFSSSPNRVSSEAEGAENKESVNNPELKW